MIWLDFFLQAFVHALAWCLAIVVTGGLIFGAVGVAFAVYVRLPAGRSAR